MKPNGSSRRSRLTALVAGLVALLSVGASGLVTSGSAAPTGSTDLKIAKTASASSVNVGSNVTYTIVVENLGPEAATGVTVSDPLPNELKLVSAASTVGQCTTQGQKLTCAIGGLETGAAPAVSAATVTVVATTQKSGSVTNTASVTADQQDTVASNNQSTVTIHVLAKPKPKPTPHRHATCRNVTATIVGTPGADTLTGTNGPDVIVGLGGNDTITSLSGKDLICAGKGNDRVNAGSAADRVFGGPGRDRILGRGGPDLLKGSRGNDVLKGNAGSDRLRGGRGVDRCSGGAGRDSIRGCER